MNQLASIRTNIFYTKDDEKYIRQNEIVLLVDEAKYLRINGEIARERGIKELRFICNEDALTALIEVLKCCQTVKEEDLK